MKDLVAMCLDRRILAVLAAVALGVWLVAPQYVLAAVPVLLLIACPASMLVMAWMMRGQMAENPTGHATPTERLDALEREHARLAAEIARARSDTNETVRTTEATEA